MRLENKHVFTSSEYTAPDYASSVDLSRKHTFLFETVNDCLPCSEGFYRSPIHFSGGT